MGCSEFCNVEKSFIYVNVAFAMYAGALLSTSTRLYWDPSTYTWMRWLIPIQYKVTTLYIFLAGVYMTVLVYVASTAVHPKRVKALRTYIVGVFLLIISKVIYGTWFVLTMMDWWETSPQADMARRGMVVMKHFNTFLQTIQKYEQVAKDIYDMMLEVEREAPNNVYVIIVFAFLAMFLEIWSLILAFKLQRNVKVVDDDDERDASTTTTSTKGSWKKNANLHMAVSEKEVNPHQMATLPLLDKKPITSD